MSEEKKISDATTVVTGYDIQIDQPSPGVKKEVLETYPLVTLGLAQAKPWWLLTTHNAMKSDKLEPNGTIRANVHQQPEGCNEWSIVVHQTTAAGELCSITRTKDNIGLNKSLTLSTMPDGVEGSVKACVMDGKYGGPHPEDQFLWMLMWPTSVRTERRRIVKCGGRFHGYHLCLESESNLRNKTSYYISGVPPSRAQVSACSDWILTKLAPADSVQRGSVVGSAVAATVAAIVGTAVGGPIIGGVVVGSYLASDTK